MKLREFKHIIWDWNGTLLNDVILCYELSRTQLASYGVTDVDFSTYHKAFGHPIIDFYRNMGCDFSKKSFAKMCTEYLEQYAAKRHTCELQPGALELIVAAQRAGIGQTIISAHQQTMLDFIVDHHNLRTFFTDVIGPEDNLAHTKLELAQVWFKRRNCRPEEVVLIGDTDHDHAVAQALGVACRLVAIGHQHRSRLEGLGAPVHDSLSDLL